MPGPSSGRIFVVDVVLASTVADSAFLALAGWANSSALAGSAPARLAPASSAARTSGPYQSGHAPRRFRGTYSLWLDIAEVPEMAVALQWAARHGVRRVSSEARRDKSR